MEQKVVRKVIALNSASRAAIDTACDQVGRGYGIEIVHMPREHTSAGELSELVEMAKKAHAEGRDGMLVAVAKDGSMVERQWTLAECSEHGCVVRQDWTAVLFLYVSNELDLTTLQNFTGDISELMGSAWPKVKDTEPLAELGTGYELIIGTEKFVAAVKQAREEGVFGFLVLTNGPVGDECIAIDDISDEKLEGMPEENVGVWLFTSGI